MKRRAFFGGLSLTAVAGFLGFVPRLSDAEPPPETTRIRLQFGTGGICVAPKYVAEDLLKAEGFAEVEYVHENNLSVRMMLLASGKTDIETTFVTPFLARLDAGDPIVVIGGLHSGCFELFATDRVRSVRDLKHKTVAVSGIESPDHAFLASILAYVGLDSRHDVTLVTHPADASMQLLAEQKIDAFLGFPPVPQELRARRIGHVMVNSAVDRPWSQYFCCMVAANGDFARKHPVATKRALRAILKGADLCALQPEWAARVLVDKRFTPRYDYALQTLKDVPYNRWRELSPEDTLRFYALRLREAGFIKATPQKLIGQGTDWRFLTELKRELKG